VIAVIALIVVYGFYQQSLQPLSFEVSGIHFADNGGNIEAIANVTDTSGPSIIQANAAVGGSDAGACGYASTYVHYPEL
jgi:hypothetical protein